MQMLRNILVGTDFSPCSEAALDAALTIANLGAARITLVHVCELSAELELPAALATPTVDEELLRACNEYLAAAIARRGSSPIEITGVLRSGRPWEKINNVAAEVGASMIVIGRHGSGRGARTELGSIADRVLRSSSRPVLTVGIDLAQAIRHAEAR